MWLSVTVQEKALKDNQKAYILVDSNGYTCGIHETQELAAKAIGSVEWNINRGEIKRSKLNKNRQSSKQPTTKK